VSELNQFTANNSFNQSRRALAALLDSWENQRDNNNMGHGLRLLAQHCISKGAIYADESGLMMKPHL
jgi:hypothetical protein